LGERDTDSALIDDQLMVYSFSYVAGVKEWGEKRRRQDLNEKAENTMGNSELVEGFRTPERERSSQADQM